MIRATRHKDGMVFEEVILNVEHDRVCSGGVTYTLDHVTPEGCSLYQSHDFRDSASFVNGRVVSGTCMVGGCSVGDIRGLWAGWSRDDANPHPTRVAPTERTFPWTARDEPAPVDKCDSGESEDDADDDASSVDNDEVADPVVE